MEERANVKEERFASFPGKVRDFLALSLERWRDGGSGGAREAIVEILGEEKDLLEMFGRIWPERVVRED